MAPAPVIVVWPNASPPARAKAAATEPRTQLLLDRVIVRILPFGPAGLPESQAPRPPP